MRSKFLGNMCILGPRRAVGIWLIGPFWALGLPSYERQTPRKYVYYGTKACCRNMINWTLLGLRFTLRWEANSLEICVFWGKAKQGARGKARQGEARQGEARQGKARQCTARREGGEGGGGGGEGRNVAEKTRTHLQGVVGNIYKQAESQYRQTNMMAKLWIKMSKPTNVISKLKMQFKNSKNEI